MVDWHIYGRECGAGRDSFAASFAVIFVTDATVAFSHVVRYCGKPIKRRESSDLFCKIAVANDEFGPETSKRLNRRQ